MTKKILTTIFVCTVAFIAHAQSTNDILLSGGIDLYKTDNIGAFKKVQFGFEGNYFVVRHLAIGAGIDTWTITQRSSFVMGARWYANDRVFVRARGLIGANDFALGVGYSKPINDRWRAEGIADYYFTGALGLRAGLSYIIK